MAFFLSPTNPANGKAPISKIDFDSVDLFALGLMHIDPEGRCALSNIYRGLRVFNKISLIIEDIGYMTESQCKDALLGEELRFPGQYRPLLIMQQMLGFISGLEPHDEICLYKVLDNIARLNANGDNIDNWMAHGARLRDRQGTEEAKISPSLWALEAGVERLSSVYASGNSVSKLLQDREKTVLQGLESEEANCFGWVAASLECWGWDFHTLFIEGQESQDVISTFWF